MKIFFKFWKNVEWEGKKKTVVGIWELFFVDRWNNSFIIESHMSENTVV